MTTLTREALLEKAKPRYKVVEIEGWGKIGLRSCPHIQASRRVLSYADDSGNFVADEQAKGGAYKIIDQVMVSEGEPMFTDDDVDELIALDDVKLTVLFSAIDKFNGFEKKTTTDESSDT